MKKIKNLLKNDLEKSLEKELNFDISQLETNKRRGFSKYRINKIIKNSVLGIICSAFLIMIMIPIIAFTKIGSKTSMIQKRYSQSELRVIEENSFVKLNDINYPSKDKIERPVSKEYTEAINNFAYKVYQNSISTESNYLYSPLSLYTVLDIISSGVSNQEILNDINQVMGTSQSVRDANYKKMYENNYYINGDGTIQMYNGLFLNNEEDYNPLYIEKISEKYTEAYQLDFSSNNDLNKMLKWVNDKVQEKNYLTLEDLDLNDDMQAYYFSTLYFNNKWSNVFSKKKTHKSSFYLNDGTIKNTQFMMHSYMGKVYSYEGYFSLYDYYKNGSSIKYIFPKDKKDNIFELLQGVNFLIDDEDRLAKTQQGGYPIINLKVPKISYSYNIDFSDILKEIGLRKLFDKDINSLDSLFKNYDSNKKFYLEWIKQKNKIEFTEDGTEVKTITMSGAAGNGSVFMDTLNATLDMPFIYVIYDSNNLPLYIGNFVNPNT